MERAREREKQTRETRETKERGVVGSVSPSNLRLDPLEQEKLVSVLARALQKYADARVYLFGSRADPTARGGDLDLLIVSSAAAREQYALRKQLSLAIQEQLGEQHVDIVVSPDLSDKPSAFARLAMLKGVRLWL